MHWWSPTKLDKRIVWARCDTSMAITDNVTFTDACVTCLRCVFEHSLPINHAYDDGLGWRPGL